MREHSKICSRRIAKSSKAASPAVSMVIITAATVVLVLVSSSFALQILDRQQASSEFDAVQTSMLTFDDAFRDIAFDRGGARSVRFTTSYGYFSLLSNEKNLDITVVAGGYSYAIPTISLGSVKYCIPTRYITYGDDYSANIIGNSSITAVTSTTDNLGCINVTQRSNFLTMELDYRVRVSQQGPAVLVNGVLVNYVDIFVLKANVARSVNVTGDFDVIARNLEINTYSYYSPEGTNTGTCNVNVKLESSFTPVNIAFETPGRVVFNLIIADIKVSN